jgi:hypothetical protein
MRLGKRLETLEAQCGGSGVRCVLLFEGQTEEDALAAFQRKYALEGADVERALLSSSRSRLRRGRRQKVTYPDLAGKLADIGVMDSEPNIRNKISRGEFPAVFLVQCSTAIGANLRL